MIEQELYIAIDAEEIAQRLGTLSGKTSAVVKVAVNSTAREARRLMLQEALRRYAINARGQKYLRELKQSKKATNARPVAELSIGGYRGFAGLRNDLAYYKVSPSNPYMGISWKNAPKFFRGKVLKQESMAKLTGNGRYSKGFLVRFKSGHVGMVQRELGVESKSKKTASGKPRWKTSKTKMVEKLRTMGSPSATAIHNQTWKAVQPQVQDILDEYVEKRIEQLLQKEQNGW